MINQDVQFFVEHPDRQARIRRPEKMIVINKQRGTNIQDECQGEFWQLGGHDKNRRRILVWKVPKDNPFYDPEKRPLLKIPFLAYADEEIADRDDMLLPLIHQIMVDAAKKEARR